MTEQIKQNPNWIDSSEYPFPPKYFDTEFGKIHYVDVGEGKPVVMIHGNPDWSFSYRHLIKALSGKNRCIALDHIGFGLSDKPDNFSYKPEDQARNFEKFMESLNLKDVTLIFNDWGGPIGFSYAIAHPEKISKLVIINTWLWSLNSDWYYQMFSRFMGGSIGRWLIRKYNFFANNVVRMAYGTKSRLTKNIHSHYLKPLENPKERKGTNVFPRHLIASGEWLGQLWQKVGVIADKPTLILWGMKDIAFRKKELNRWKSVMKNFKVQTFDDAGHYPHEERHEEAAKIIESFLA